MNQMEWESVLLSGGDVCVTPDPGDAWRVVSGSVYVYIVPWVKGKTGRRSFLCRAEAGDMIPAYSWRDPDYRSWRFCLAAVDEAELSRMAGCCTEPLKQKFLLRAGVKNPAGESYESALAEVYRLNLVQEDGFLVRTEQEKQEIGERTDRLILSFFTKKKTAEEMPEDREVYSVVAALAKSMRIPVAPFEKVEACCGKEPSVKDIARISHIPVRDVVLEEDWYKSDAGGLLVRFGENAELAACLPCGGGGYRLYRNGRKTVRVTAELAAKCDPQAVMVYRPFPEGSLSAKGLVRFCIAGLSWRDLVSVALLTILSSLIGLLLPTLNEMLYDSYIPMGETSVILQLGCILAAFMLGNLVFSVVKSIAAFRLDSHIRYEVQNAVYYRIFELPEHFFRRYESADLAGRIMELGELAGNVAGLVLSLVLALVQGMFFLVRMFQYSVVLSVASLIMQVLFSLFLYLSARYQQRYQKEIMEQEGKNDSMLFQFISGIEKIRIAGMEDRAVYEYLKAFLKQRKTETDLSRVSNLTSVIASLGSGLFSVVTYLLVYQSSGLTMGSFVAFQSAFGVVSSSISSLVNGAVSWKMLKPAWARVEDILKTAPESTGDRRLPGRLTGRVDVDHVSFSYDENSPLVLKDLSVHIEPGDYVGIVGTSGCGKSTFLKLLLGFEHPTSGRIYYDSQDMGELDLQELRKQFGVVLQDGELISGSLYENITLTAPQATYAEVEKVVEEVGLKKDVDEMPMGLQTLVSENCSTISGGQKQRVLIARALMNRPRVLLFDEATSALDNLTQQHVTSTLERMDATRIVIAHRLTTIKNCRRILVFDQGKIREEGSYESLMEQKGMFYELARRQLM